MYSFSSACSVPAIASICACGHVVDVSRTCRGRVADVSRTCIGRVSWTCRRRVVDVSWTSDWCWRWMDPSGTASRLRTVCARSLPDLYSISPHLALPSAWTIAARESPTLTTIRRRLQEGSERGPSKARHGVGPLSPPPRARASRPASLAGGGCNRCRWSRPGSHFAPRA